MELLSPADRSGKGIAMTFRRPPAQDDAQLLASAVEAIHRQTARRPRFGLILGSGLGSLADDIDDPAVVAFTDLPGFPAPTVPGHTGEVVIGTLAGQPVAALRGRVHFYEGHSMAEVVFPVRVLAALGCESLIVTNSAGGLNPEFRPGDLMAITDHVFLPGLVGLNPLVNSSGPAPDRFVDMTRAYDRLLRESALAAARRIGFSLRQGVYIMVGGPTYETPAEQRLLRLLGGDAVGMSTAPEVVVARQLGLRVLGLSLITNLALADTDTPVSHAEVLSEASRSADRFRALVTEVVAAVDSTNDAP